MKIIFIIFTALVTHTQPTNQPHSQSQGNACPLSHTSFSWTISQSVLLTTVPIIMPAYTWDFILSEFIYSLLLAVIRTFKSVPITNPDWNIHFHTTYIIVALQMCLFFVSWKITPDNRLIQHWPKMWINTSETIIYPPTVSVIVNIQVLIHIYII